MEQARASLKQSGPSAPKKAARPSKENVDNKRQRSVDAKLVEKKRQPSANTRKSLDGLHLEPKFYTPKN